MQIAGNSVHTSGFSPTSQQAIVDARAERRSEEQQQRPVAVNEEQRRKELQASGEVVSAVSRDEALGFRKVAEATGSNKQFALYSETDQAQLPNSQRKALQAYTETENISRVDADIDYLGSVDIFV